MIIYTAHAQERMEMRRIKKGWIEEAITNPDSVIDVKYGRKQAVQKIKGEEISVVYVEKGDHFVVITVFWGK
ncbi:MAG: DUF4258 domain-containing protein [Acidobacteria bacterium]|nr:DUF4258 domain-containing protein [Acidobacteriota bacterium]